MFGIKGYAYLIGYNIAGLQPANQFLNIPRALPQAFIFQTFGLRKLTKGNSKMAPSIIESDVN